MKVLFIVNERSGRKRRFPIADVIRGASPFDTRVMACSRKEDLDAMIDDAERDGVEVVFAVGGDGTVHETAKRLIGRKPALGILPIGSGNGFARHVGLPMLPEHALAACAGGHIETIDTGIANSHPFLGVMGIGFDALIAERFAPSSVRGLGTYVKEGIRAFREFSAEEYEVTANGETIRRRAFVIAIANSGQYGNNARIAPLASLQDALLEVVIVDPPNLARAILLLPRLFHGSIHKARGVTTLRTSELTIRRATAGGAHLDGEPVTLAADLHVRVVPRSLKLLVPDCAKAL